MTNKLHAILFRLYLARYAKRLDQAILEAWNG